MCTSKQSLQGAIGETLFLAEMLCKAEIYYDDYDIIAEKSPVEGRPFDCKLYITKKLPNKIDEVTLEYRVQVKSTFKIKDGRLIFNTNHSGGKRYTEKEIDLFFLCYHNLQTKESWYGLALPSECMTSTVFAYEKTPTGAEKSIEDYDLDTRFDELLQYGHVEPLDIVSDEPDDIKDLQYEEEPEETVPLNLDDDNTFLSLMIEQDFDLDFCSKAVKMNKKTFMKHYNNFVNRSIYTA